MDSHLAEWLLEANMTSDPDTTERRRRGVEACSKWLRPSHANSMARLIIQDLAPNSAFGLEFCGVFEKADESFTRRGNNYELAVLAAAVAELVLEERSDRSHLLAFSLASAAFVPHKNTPPVPFVIDLAERCLASHSRQRSSMLKQNWTDARVVGIEGGTDTLPKALTDNDLPSLADQLPAAVSQLAASVNRIIEHQEAMSHRLDLLSEEYNILWWLYGQYSHCLGKSMKSVAASSAPILAGKELADLVVILPGPWAFREFLAHTLTHCMSGYPASITLLSAVNGLPRDWRERYIASTDPHSMGRNMPLHLAIRTSIETEGADEWWPVYKKRTGIAKSTTFEPLLLSVQAYREALVFRHVYQQAGALQ